MKDVIYISLGKLVVNYTSLEFFLSILINTLKNTKTGGLTYIKDKGVFKTTEKIKNYSTEKIKDIETHEALCSLMDKVNTVRGQRNTLLHSAFFQDSKTDKAIQVDILKTIESSQNISKSISENDINKVSKDTLNLISEITFLILHLNQKLKK